MDNSDIADLFGVTIQTVRYWNKYGFPKYATERLSLIDGTHPDWLGFKIESGQVWTPAGELVLKSQIEHYHWLLDQATNESKRNSQLEARMRGYDELKVSANESSFVEVAKLLK